MIFQCPNRKCRLIIDVIVDDIEPKLLCSQFLNSKIQRVAMPKDSEITNFNKYIETLTLKDLLVYSSEELTHRFAHSR